MFFKLHDRVVDRLGNEGTVDFVYYNRATNECSYHIVWDNDMSGSFEDWQIRLNQIKKVIVRNARV
jgi:hypothetical protein